MKITKDILQQIIKLRSINCIVYGSNLKLFDGLTGKKKISYQIEFEQSNNLYSINCNHIKKQPLMSLLEEISSSPDYYGATIQKKMIILFNLHKLNDTIIQKIKTLSEKSYETVCFIMHINSYNYLNNEFKSRFQLFSLPESTINDDTIDITYHKITQVLKTNLDKNNIILLREICYMYYMNHESSVDLQKYIIQKIGSINTLPNIIKMNILNDIVELNKMYRYSYRKPIFLEAIIYCLCKHLEHYAFHL